jgi:hypothetical protein
MSRLVKILVSILTVLVVAGLVNKLHNVLAQDPFARYHAAPTLGIEMKGVTMETYNGNKKIGSAKIDKVTVRQDHQFLDMQGISDGHFVTPVGPFDFTAQTANYNALTRQMMVTSSSHVSTKDANLNVPGFVFDVDASTVKMPSVLTGSLYGGKVVGRDLTYTAKPGFTHYSFVGDWQGVPPKDAGTEVLQLPQGQSPPVRTKWRISGAVDFLNGIGTYTNIRASDDEILVTAPKGVLDQHTDVLTLTGPVYYYSDKANCVCDKAVIYRKEKRAVLSGNVHMLVKPKDQEKLQVSEIPPWKPPVPDSIAANRPPAPQNAESQQEKDLDDELRSSKTTRKYPAHIKADEITYWYGKGSRHAVITGSPDCYQEFPGGRWRRVVTHEGLYDGEKDVLTLKSTAGQKDTRMVDSIGDDLVSSQFTVSTKEDDEKYSSPDAEGVISSDEDEVPTFKNGGNNQPPASTAPSTPTPAPQTPPKTGG